MWMHTLCDTEFRLRFNPFITHYEQYSYRWRLMEHKTPSSENPSIISLDTRHSDRIFAAVRTNGATMLLTDVGVDLDWHWCRQYNVLRDLWLVPHCPSTPLCCHLCCRHAVADYSSCTIGRHASRCVDFKVQACKNMNNNNRNRLQKGVYNIIELTKNSANV